MYRRGRLAADGFLVRLDEGRYTDFDLGAGSQIRAFPS